MADKAITVGAFEAKTRLSELLREAEHGTPVVIRRRGKTVAWLVPPPRHESWSPAEILSGFREIRGRAGAPMKVRELIGEGRRY
jgi:prevent-host-death family protein